VAWHELGRGLSLAAQGLEVDYRGVTGAVDLDERGDLLEGKVELWTIRRDRIEALE
jgi:hypothetical protein